MEWMPIESAPEGMWVLIYSKWSGVEKSLLSNGEWSDNSKEHYDVTHWAYLPEPPKQNGE